jgi:DNA-binding transcriptional ArsR family regulator
MNDPDFAAVAALAGEPARAAMLTALFDGRALPAGDLARAAGVSPATASAHLGKLVDGGLVRVRSQGRHRYYQLARPEIARALEALGAIAAPAPIGSLGGSLRMQRLRFARSCYDHLAGELALAIVSVLVQRHAMEPDGDGFCLREPAAAVFAEIGIDAGAALVDPGAHVQACIDWTQRQHHISGPLGVAMLASFLERKLLRRRAEPRTLELTEEGRTLFARFGVTLHLQESA